MPLYHKYTMVKPFCFLKDYNDLDIEKNPKFFFRVEYFAVVSKPLSHIFKKLSPFLLKDL